MASTPAKPPPTKTKVSKRLRRSVSLDAGEDPVAQGGGLLDLLEAHGLLRQAGDRQGAGLGAQGDDEVVVGQGVGLDPLVRGLGGRGTHGDGAARVVDGGDGAGDDGDAVEVTAVGGDVVARLDGAGRDLRQEGLVGHVGERGSMMAISTWSRLSWARRARATQKPT